MKDERNEAPATDPDARSVEGTPTGGSTAGFRRRKAPWTLGACFVLFATLMLMSVGGENLSGRSSGGGERQVMDFSAFSEAKPERPVDILFIHHSVGGQWLAAPGPASGSNCIYATHPNGGGLRAALEEQGYVVHEASYASRIGQNTDLFDWLPKFGRQMDEVLICARQDEPLPAGRRNQVILFKSCFPNSRFQSEGQAPGNPAGPTLTLADAQAGYRALLSCFERQPRVLFVCVTTPPLAPRVKADPLWKVLARAVLGKPSPARSLLRSGELARRFNAWLQAPDGWLKDYPLKNVVVFDYCVVLTGGAAFDFLLYPTGDGYDSHPSSEGQRLATQALVPFLNRAVRRLHGGHHE